MNNQNTEKQKLMNFVNEFKQQLKEGKNDLLYSRGANGEIKRVLKETENGYEIYEAVTQEGIEFDDGNSVKFKNVKKVSIKKGDNKAEISANFSLECGTCLTEDINLLPTKISLDGDEDRKSVV